MLAGMDRSMGGSDGIDCHSSADGRDRRDKWDGHHRSMLRAHR